MITKLTFDVEKVGNKYILITHCFGGCQTKEIYESKLQLCRAIRKYALGAISWNEEQATNPVAKE